MAVVVPLVAAVAGNAVAGALGTGLLPQAFGFLVTTAINQIGSRAFTKKPRLPSLGQEASVRSLMTISGVESHKIIYGTVRTSGSVVLDTTNDGLVGASETKYSHILIALAGHEVEEISSIYLNDQVVSLDGNGEVTSAPYFKDGKSYARIRKLNGSNDQLASGEMINEIPDWTANHRLRGIAYLWVRFVRNADVYPNGFPNISCIVKGKKVFDPRTSTTAWSQNAALCVRDYLTSRDGAGLPYGFGAYDDEVNDDYFIAAANICDEDVTLKTGGTIKRYTCNGVLDTAVLPFDNLPILISSLAGAITYVQGKFRIHAAAYDSPSGDIDESMIVGEMNVVTATTKKELFNAVKGTFVDPSKAYQPTDFPAVTNAFYQAQDNGEQIFRDIELPFTNNGESAQRIAKIILEKGRQGIVVEMPVNHKALKYSVYDVVRLNNELMGWVNKPFRITKWAMENPGPITMTLQEESSASYDWNNGEATVIDTAPNTNIPSPWSVGEPQGLSAQSGEDQLLIAGDGTLITRILLSWAAPQSAFVDRTEIQYRRLGSGEWVNAPDAINGTTSAYIFPVDDGAVYNLRARHRNTIGSYSPWTEIAHTVVGKSAPPDDVVIFDIEGDRLAWTVVTNPDLAGYRIKYQTGTSQSWGDAIPLHAGLLTDSPYMMNPRPAGPVTIMIKAVDTSGNESTNPAYIVTDLGDPDVANVIVQFDRKAAIWPGSLSGGTIDGSNNLAANSITPLMWGDPNANMWSENSSTLMWSTVQYSEMRYEDRVTVTAALAGSRLTLDYTIAGETWSVFYRENSSSLMWSPDPSTPMWNANGATPMWYTPDWLPWPGSIEAKNSIYDFLIVTSQASTQGYVSKFIVVLDAPDIDEILNNIAIGSGGTRLPITKTYQVISNIQMTVQSDGGGAINARYIDKDATLGPLVQCINASGTAVSGTIDARIKGY